MSYLRLSDLKKDYKTENNVFTALKNVNLSLEKGSFTVIKGASGSGKSTLLNMVSGIDSPTSGEIIINGTAIQKLNSNQLAKWRGTEIGIVFQFFQLMPTLTVVENIILPMEFAKKISRPQHRGRAMQLLEKLNISALANKYPNTLSGGEKQRVAIARALANNPNLLIADEPTGNLDSENTAIIHEIFEQLNRDGKTILYVTHEQGFPKGFTQVVNISDGTIAEIVEKEMEAQNV